MSDDKELRKELSEIVNTAFGVTGDARKRLMDDLAKGGDPEFMKRLANNPSREVFEKLAGRGMLVPVPRGSLNPGDFPDIGKGLQVVPPIPPHMEKQFVGGRIDLTEKTVNEMIGEQIQRAAEEQAKKKSEAFFNQYDARMMKTPTSGKRFQPESLDEVLHCPFPNLDAGLQQGWIMPDDIILFPKAVIGRMVHPAKVIASNVWPVNGWGFGIRGLVRLQPPSPISRGKVAPNPPQEYKEATISIAFEEREVFFLGIKRLVKVLQRIGSNAAVFFNTPWRQLGVTKIDIAF